MVSILLPLKERQLLLHGYVRNCNVNMTLDLVSLCSLMYGDETFYWKISAQHVLDINHQMPITASLKSGVFIYRGVEFQLDIYKVFNAYVNNLHYHNPSIKLRCTLKSRNVILDTKIKLCIEEIGFTVNSFRTNFISYTWHDNALRLSDISIDSNQNQLNIICKLDPLKIEPVNDTNIRSFCKNVIFKQTSNIKWQLDDKMTPSLNNFPCTWYESPEYHNGNFRIVMCETDNVIRIQLGILSFPSMVDHIHVKWICIANYNGNIKKIQSHFVFSREKWCDISVRPIDKNDLLDQSNNLNRLILSLLCVNIKVFIVDIQDEFGQFVPWQKIRHWPQYNVINEQMSINLSNVDTYDIKNLKQDIDDVKLTQKQLRKQLSDLSCFVKEKLLNVNNVKAKYDIDMNIQTSEMIEIKEW
eukprot:508618_1